MAAKKILILEDTKEYQDKYCQWARDLGFEVTLASTVKEGIELFRKIKPDAVITDYGLPDGTGNELAQIVKREHSVPIAGITAGDSKSFSENVDIPETKSMGKEYFTKIVGYLFSENPSKQYLDEQKIIKSRTNNSEMVCAAGILFQGYYVASALRQGLEEIVSNGEIIASKQDMKNMVKVLNGAKYIQEPSSVFELVKEGVVNLDQAYGLVAEMFKETQGDTHLASVFSRVTSGDYNLSIDDAVYAARKLIKTLEKAGGR